MSVAENLNFPPIAYQLCRLRKSSKRSGGWKYGRCGCGLESFDWEGRMSPELSQRHAREGVGSLSITEVVGSYNVFCPHPLCISESSAFPDSPLLPAGSRSSIRQGLGHRPARLVACLQALQRLLKALASLPLRKLQPVRFVQALRANNSPLGSSGWHRTS